MSELGPIATTVLYEDDEVRIATDLNEDIVSFHVGAPVEEGEPKWSNYIRGVVRGFRQGGRRAKGPHRRPLPGWVDGVGIGPLHRTRPGTP